MSHSRIELTRFSDAYLYLGAVFASSVCSGFRGSLVLSATFQVPVPALLLTMENYYLFAAAKFLHGFGAGIGQQPLLNRAVYVRP